MMTVQVVVLAALFAFSACCFRLAAWHRHEAEFWHHIAIMDAAGMAPTDAPDLLRWVQEHRPSLLARLRGWRAPHERRRRVPNCAQPQTCPDGAQTDMTRKEQR